MPLIGYWPLNESSKDPDAPTAKDHSGNENHGTINDGGDSTVPGAKGVLGQNAYSFDGSNDYVVIPFAPKLKELTITFWFKTNTVTSDHDYFISHYGGEHFLVRIDGNGYVDFVVDDGDSATWSFETEKSYNDGEWHFAAMVFDANNFIKGIVDKNEMEESVSQGVIDTSGDLFLGSLDGTDLYYPGKLAEVRIYNHALTPAEIQYLYQVGKRGRQVTSVKKS